MTGGTAVARGAALGVGTLLGLGMLVLPGLAVRAVGPGSLLAWAALLCSPKRISDPPALDAVAIGARLR